MGNNLDYSDNLLYPSKHAKLLSREAQFDAIPLENYPRKTFEFLRQKWPK